MTEELTARERRDEPPGSGLHHEGQHGGPHEGQHEGPQSGQPPAPGGAAPEAGEPPLLELSGVRRVYRFGEASVNALDGVDLRIERGSFVGIVGRSGSGKSTLLNVLGGLDRPTAGTLRVEGRPLEGRRSDELAAYRRSTIGFVFQSFNLLPHLTALENVALPLRLAGVLGPAARRARALALLEQVGLGSRTGHRPPELSGGERQRVAIARALANDPALLLADEPTGNLDSRSAATIVELLVRLNREHGRTVVLVTHDLAQAERCCRRIVEMADGRITADRPARAPAPAAAQPASAPPEGEAAGSRRDAPEGAPQEVPA